MAAVVNVGHALQYASKELQNNMEIVTAAVVNDGYALEYASEELRNNKGVVMSAVMNRGYFLLYASGELQNNKEIVMAAVMSHGTAIQYASAELRNNKEIVMAAVVNIEYALQYASDQLKRNDADIAIAAIQKTFDLVANNIRLVTAHVKHMMEHPLYKPFDAIEWWTNKRPKNMAFHAMEINKLDADIKSYCATRSYTYTYINCMASDGAEYQQNKCRNPTVKCHKKSSTCFATALEFASRIRTDMYESRWCLTKVNFHSLFSSIKSIVAATSDVTAIRSNRDINNDDNETHRGTIFCDAVLNQIWSFSGIETANDNLLVRLDKYTEFVDLCAMASSPQRNQKESEQYDNIMK